MRRGTPAGPFSKAAIALIIVATISGCMSEEKADPVDQPISDSVNDDELAIDNELSGSVGDGPIVGAIMSAIRNDGQSLMQFESDASAGYNIVIRTKGKYYPVVIEARNGIDLVTNMAPDFVLSGAALEPKKKSVSNVSPYSTLAMLIAKELPGGISKANIQNAETIATTVFNNGLSTLLEFGPSRTLIDASNVAEIVKASEAVGEVVRRVRDLQNSFNRSASGDTVISSIASDLTDGVIDGVGGVRVNGRIAALTTVLTAQTALESMQNELFVNGQNATASMNNAIATVAGSKISPTLAEIAVTPGMLRSALLGLDASIAVVPSAKLQELRDAVSGVEAGMEPAVVKNLIPVDYKTTMEQTVTTIAGGDDQMIATINEVSRNGGTGSSDVNTGPTISGSPATSVATGNPYSFTPTATDAEGDTLTFSISGQPTWADFNPTSGELSGTPGADDAGFHGNIVISVSDGDLSSSLPAFGITVSHTNTGPTISGTPATSVAAGARYSFTPTASDPEGDALTFSISGQPNWADFSSTTGELSGTPGSTDTGVHGNIVISVSDGDLNSSLAAFSVTVSHTNTAPTISGSPATTANANEPYSFVPTASDADGDALTFSISGQPSWAEFDTRTGELSGTPTDAHVGVYNDIRISVSDPSDASANLEPFSISVNTVSLGSVTLNWTAPTQNEDGTALTDLAGYKIYWGTTSGAYTNSVTLDNPGLTTYVVENLSAGWYEFTATSYNTSGVESDHSNPTAITVD